MVMASGMPADRLDLDAFMAQAMEYENWEDSHDRVRRFFFEIGATHSYAVRRVSEVMRWVQSGEYDRIQRGEYRRRGDETDVREEAGEAMEFYAERFRALFREFGENVTNLGTQVGDASQQVADWLRNRGGGSAAGLVGLVGLTLSAPVDLPAPAARRRPVPPHRASAVIKIPALGSWMHRTRAAAPRSTSHTQRVSSNSRPSGAGCTAPVRAAGTPPAPRRAGITNDLTAICLRYIVNASV